MKEREKVTTVFHADMVLRNGGCAGLDLAHGFPVCTLEQFSCLDDGYAQGWRQNYVRV
jgi:hypothetical protein